MYKRQKWVCTQQYEDENTSNEPLAVQSIRTTSQYTVGKTYYKNQVQHKIKVLIHLSPYRFRSTRQARLSDQVNTVYSLMCSDTISSSRTQDDRRTSLRWSQESNSIVSWWTVWTHFIKFLVWYINMFQCALKFHVTTLNGHIFWYGIYSLREETCIP